MRKSRLAAGIALTALLVAAAGVVTWRVLRPSEVVTTAAKPKDVQYLPAPGWQSNLRTAPLFVDLRVRVYAAKHRVWADATPDRNYETSAYWSYRRWPAQLIGVVATPEAVVSSWSDGILAGTDVITGKLLWHKQSDVLGTEYTGRRTGAGTVYTPPGLFTAGSHIIVSGPKTISGYAGKSGEQLWTRPAPACRGTQFTSPTQLVYLDTCTGTVHALDAATGADSTPATGVTTLEPISCLVGSSSCAGARTTGKAWLLPSFTASAPLVEPGAFLSGGTVVTSPATNELVGRDPLTGAPKWRWQLANEARHNVIDPGPAMVVSANADRIFLLTPQHTLIAVSGAMGEELTRYSIVPEYEIDGPYDIAYAYSSGRWLVLVRTKPGASAESKDDQYYLIPRPVLVAGS